MDSSFEKQRPPVDAQAADSWVNPIDGSVLVFVPPGPFVMGGDEADIKGFFQKYRFPLDQVHHYLDETPTNEIELSGYWIGKYCVTNEQFVRFLTESERTRAPGLTDEEKSNYERVTRPAPGYPVSGITHSEAAAYCEWAGLALPTEAEWEKAARGTDRKVFPWGNTYHQEMVNTFEISHPFPDGIKVQELEAGASPYGCIQMAGNVYEWCADWYDPKCYRMACKKRNPVGPSSGIGKVIRGGATHKVLVYARTTSRNYWTIDTRDDFTGFRPVYRF